MNSIQKKKLKKAAAEAVKRETHEIDLSGVVLGRAATDVALLLSGKRKVGYVWHIDAGDKVKAYNLKKIAFTGKNKPQKKMYYRYTGYPGGIKEASLAELFEKNPQKVFWNAVYGMLPKNKLRSLMIKRLEIIEGELPKA